MLKKQPEVMSPDFFKDLTVFNVIFSGETLNLIFTDSSANKMSGIPGLLFTLALRF